jgi:hypothetical protein
MTPRERFHLETLSSLAARTPDEAAIWLDRHGAPSVGAAEPPSALLGPLQRQVERCRHRTLAANLHRIARFQEIADRLREVGIPVCPLKGLHLLATVYADDPEHRPMADVDLLVRAEDVDRTVDRLSRVLGLRETALSRRLVPRSHERVLTGTALVVEVHIRLGLRTGRRTTWRDLDPRPVRWHGRRVFALDRDTTLAYLLAHFVQHVPWSRRFRVEDILRWAERGYDPERTLERASRLGVRRMLVAAVRSLRRHLGAEALPGLPDRDRGFGRLLLSGYETLVCGRSQPRPEGGSGEVEASRSRRALGTLLLADRPRDLVPFLRSRSREAFEKRNVRKTTCRATPE